MTGSRIVSPSPSVAMSASSSAEVPSWREARRAERLGGRQLQRVELRAVGGDLRACRPRSARRRGGRRRRSSRARSPGSPSSRRAPSWTRRSPAGTRRSRCCWISSNFAGQVRGAEREDGQQPDREDDPLRAAAAGEGQELLHGTADPPVGGTSPVLAAPGNVRPFSAAACAIGHTGGLRRRQQRLQLGGARSRARGRRTARRGTPRRGRRPRGGPRAAGRASARPSPARPARTRRGRSADRTTRASCATPSAGPASASSRAGPTCRSSAWSACAKACGCWAQSGCTSSRWLTRGVLVARLAGEQREPQEPERGRRGAGGDRVVLDLLAPRDQRLAVVGGREEAAVLGVGEAREQLVGGRRARRGTSAPRTSPRRA